MALQIYIVVHTSTQHGWLTMQITLLAFLYQLYHPQSITYSTLYILSVPAQYGLCISSTVFVLHSDGRRITSVSENTFGRFALEHVHVPGQHVTEYSRMHSLKYDYEVKNIQCVALCFPVRVRRTCI